MIEELWALGKGVCDLSGKSPEDEVLQWITGMNPFLPNEVGILDTRTMNIVPTNPRTNKTVRQGNVLYMSGARSDPATTSPAAKADTTKNFEKSIENFEKSIDTLLSWQNWDNTHKEELAKLKNNAGTVVANAKASGVKYVIIQFDGVPHTRDQNVRDYVKGQLKAALMKDAVSGTCMICGKKTQVTGAALRLANLKFATPDKEVFVPLAASNKNRAFSAQFPLCYEDALYVMIGAAFAASDIDGHLKGKIQGPYSYLVLPLPVDGHEADAVDLIIQQGKPESIAGLEDVQDSPFPFLQKPAIQYVSIYFLEKGARSTNITGAAKYVSPNIIAALHDARNNAEMETEQWFGSVPYAPKWTGKINIFYDFAALQIVDQKISESEMNVITKEAIKQYIHTLQGLQNIVEEWIKRVTVKNASKMLLSGDNRLESYLRRSVAALLTIKSVSNGGGKVMGVKNLLEEAKRTPDMYVSFLAGVLSAEAMYQQRKAKNLEYGEEPLRKAVGNAAVGDLEDFKRILVLAVDKINQYGGSPAFAVADYPVDVEELMHVKKSSRTEDLRYAFVLGLLVGESEYLRKRKKEVEENGETA